MKTMTRVLSVFILGGGLLSGGFSRAAEKPNFLVILADDMGFSDAGCYGGEIKTPNLDTLAARGLRFTRFYNTARCWPTRAALLTGYYPQQIRRDAMPGVDRKLFGVQGARPPWAHLLPRALRPLGYRSYHSGKWHVDGAPLANGFDRSYEIVNEESFFNLPHALDGNALPPSSKEAGYYATTAIADYAIQFLKEHAARYADRPFFHYLAFTAPHFPLHALPEDIARYRDRYLEGWDALRRERLARLHALGITQTKLSPLEPDVGPPYDFAADVAKFGSDEITRPFPWEQLTPAQQRLQATKMAIHAAMVDRMDREIGRVLAQLRAMNALDTTVVMFLSDNGASAEMMVRGDGHDPSAPPGSARTHYCLGPGFSSAANTPFRRHKTWLQEGGIATPFIVSWPQGIAARNELRVTPAHVIDIAPTILELAGAPIEAGPNAPPLPGHSLVPVFPADGAPLHEALWFYHEGSRALIQGDWKIVHEMRGRVFPWTPALTAVADKEPVTWALHNLAEDRAEQNDVAARYPERVREMVRIWTQYKDRFTQEANH